MRHARASGVVLYVCKKLTIRTCCMHSAYMQDHTSYILCRLLHLHGLGHLLMLHVPATDREFEDSLELTQATSHCDQAREMALKFERAEQRKLDNDLRIVYNLLSSH